MQKSTDSLVPVPKLFQTSGFINNVLVAPHVMIPQCFPFQACLPKFPLSIGTHPTPPGKTRNARELMLPGQTSTNNWQELMNKHSNSSLVSSPESALRSTANQLKPLKAFYLWYQNQYIQKSSPTPTSKEPIAIYLCNCTLKIKKWPYRPCAMRIISLE